MSAHLGNQLLLALQRGRIKKACRLILDGADVNMHGLECGCSALHLAALLDRSAVAMLLLIHGAYQEAVNSEGETACEVALHNNSLNVYTLLRAKAGWSPFRIAAVHGTPYLCTLALRRGSINPARFTSQEIAAAIAIGGKSMRLSLMPWRVQSHKWTTAKHRSRVSVVMHVVNRLAAQPSTDMFLPVEMWFHILSFIPFNFGFPPPSSEL